MRVLPVGSGEYPWVFKIVLYGFKIFGLAPFRLEIKACKMFAHSNSTNKAVEYLFSSMGTFYNLLLITTIIVTSAIAFPSFFKMNYTNKSAITEVVDMMQVPLCVSVACIILTLWAFRQCNAASIMNRLVKIDFLLSGLKIPESRSEKMMVLRFMVHVIVSVSILAPFTILGALVFHDNLVSWFCCTTSNLIIYWFMIQYFVIVGLVSTDIETINKTLSKLNDFSEHSYDANTTVLSLSTYSQLAAVRLLKSLRTRVSEASRDIAEFYSFPMLGCIAYSFVTLVYNIYYLITPIIIPEDHLSLPLITFTITCTLVGFHPLILLSFKITKLENEAKLSGWVIQKLLATALRQDIKAELEQFSHQLLHENISFTACGLFSLDCTLLHSMLAAAATYLVILLQFLQSTHT